MRLTLRTLLAYLDGVLDPADQQDIQQQIDRSPDAKELVLRIRDTMRRVRLETPPLGDDPDAPAPLFDANTVAEYLDNTASPQSVIDFELESLKSDSQLAEVAACHHVLTMVLGERAEIDPEARRRMYGIPELASQRAAGEAPPTDPSSPPTDESVREIPDYLRPTPGASIARWLPAVAALLLLGAVSFLAFRDGGWLRGDGGNGAIADGGDAPDPSPRVTPPEPSKTEGDESEGDDSQGDDSEQVESALSPGADADAQDSDPDDQEDQPDAGSGAPIRMTDNGADDQGPIEEPVEDPVDNAQDPQTPGGSESELAGDDGQRQPGSEGMETDGMESESDEASSNENAGDDLGGTDLAVPDEPLPAGLLTSPQEVLLRYEAESKSWRRLPVRTAVMTTNQLLSLPTYHPTVTLDSGLSVQLVDGTQMQIAPTPPADPPRLALLFGRLILTNSSGEPMRFDLAIGGVLAKVELAGRSVLAVESARPFVPGSDPMQEQSPLQSTVYAPSGGVLWTSPAAELVLSEAGSWRIAGDSVGPVEPLAEKPEWIDGRTLSAWESEATDEVEAKIAAGEPVWPQLMEVFGSDLKEERALAAASSSFVGHFDPFIRALGEEDLKPAWDDVIATLRLSMARSPQTAQKVRQTLVEMRPPDQVDDLYEMLCGYSEAQIGATKEEWAVGPMRQLVDWLGSPHLEYRSLANYNLEQISGRRGVFNPIAPPRRRESAVRRLESRLERGELPPTFAR